MIGTESDFLGLNIGPDFINHVEVRDTYSSNAGLIIPDSDVDVTISSRHGAVAGLLPVGETSLVNVAFGESHPALAFQLVGRELALVLAKVAESERPRALLSSVAEGSLVLVSGAVEVRSLSFHLSVAPASDVTIAIDEVGVPEVGPAGEPAVAVVELVLVSSFLPSRGVLEGSLLLHNLMQFDDFFEQFNL